MTVQEYLEGKDRTFVQEFVNNLMSAFRDNRTEAANNFAAAAEKFINYKDAIERTEEAIKNGAGYGDEWLVELKELCAELSKAKSRLDIARSLYTEVSGYALSLNDIDYTENLDVTKSFFATYEPTDGGNSDLTNLFHLGMLSLGACIENAEASIKKSKLNKNHNTSWVDLLSNCVNALVDEGNKFNTYHEIINKVIHNQRG